MTKINHQHEIKQPDTRLPEKNEDQTNTVNRNVYQDSHLQGGKLENYELDQREEH